DLHEGLVQVRGGGGVLERLMRHHVAPVTRGVPDAEQHGDVTSSRLGERVVTPLVPVDGVVGVLQQVRRCAVHQAVRHGSSLSRRCARPLLGTLTSARFYVASGVRAKTIAPGTSSYGLMTSSPSIVNPASRNHPETVPGRRR